MSNHVMKAQLGNTLFKCFVFKLQHMVLQYIADSNPVNHQSSEIKNAYR